jgi:lipoprotein-anchoring transpeptidase ErfK/SrfK
VKATDTLDQSTTTTYTLLVDSTESLSQTHGLRAGARGRDVVELQQALIADGGAKRAALASEISQQTYGRATASAVSAFQNSRGMSADGIAGQDTIAALTMRIVVDRASHTLTLYQRGKIAKTYGIAVGSPTYPTPAGSFEIVSMQMHPTWTPPDSDWAKDAEVIPPGPDNPLGTRWMGLSAPGGTVGIHGTNSPASIGYSVSHGCIRMAIPDVEDLYDRVATGTPVEIR